MIWLTHADPADEAERREAERRIAMTSHSKLDLLIGKYFLAPFPHDDGVVEAVIDDEHCLVRFEAGTDGRPEALAVVALSDIVKPGYNGEEDEPPNWLFFDSPEQRAKYRAWINNPDEPNKLRIVPMRRPSSE